MDPGHQRTTDDLRESPRKARDTIRVDALRTQNERPEAERLEIERDRLRYKELFEFAPDAYIVTDVDGTIREANIASGKLLGVAPRLLTGKSLPSFFDAVGRREYRRQLDHLCDFDRLDDWEIGLRPRHKEYIAVSVSISRAAQKEADAGTYRWILRDISNRVHAEQALRDLNHELRNPLQAIFGYTELLERQVHGPLNEAQLGDLRRIQQSQQHLLGLINTILDFARVDDGEKKAEA